MTDTSSRQIGIVKWFDNKKGFGMITVMESTHANKDIFVHHTEVNVSVQQYRYLVAGEYVSFGVNQIVGDETKLTATNIKGVLGGPVMCETLNAEKLLKNAYHSKRRLEYENASKKSPAPVPVPVVAPSVPDSAKPLKKNIKAKKDPSEPPKKRVSKK
jgi:cold shock CspA family protein